MSALPADDNEAQVFQLGAPLRIVNAYTQRLARRHRGYSSQVPHHFLEVAAGPHLIVIDVSPTGASVRVSMDGRELS